MSNGATNIDRLKAADLIDTTYLTVALTDEINKATISDQEIQVLKDIKKKLKLYKIQLGVYIDPAAGGV
jgi:hypothetical protein